MHTMVIRQTALFVMLTLTAFMVHAQEIERRLRGAWREGRACPVDLSGRRRLGNDG